MKISVVQMCSSSLPDKNIAEVAGYFATAAEQSSDLIVLPENFLAIGARFRTLCNTQWSDYIDAISLLSKKYQLPCVAGTVPVEDKNDSPKRLASSMYFDAEGRNTHTYNKIHLFDVDIGDEKGVYRESNYYSHGDVPVLVTQGEANIGMAVCFDLRFPALFQHYKREGANLIVLPSAFTALTGKKHWETLLKARAIETQSFIVAPNQVGTHEDGRSTWGHAMVIDPDGNILLDMKENIGVQTVEIDFQCVTDLRSAVHLKPRI